jgi:hypothetical protein
MWDREEKGGYYFAMVEYRLSLIEGAMLSRCPFIKHRERIAGRRHQAFYFMKDGVVTPTNKFETMFSSSDEFEISGEKKRALDFQRAYLGE